MNFPNFNLVIDEKFIFYGILSFMCAEFLWEFYLEIRQVSIQPSLPVF